METLIIVVHVLACIFLIVAVMLQSGHEGMGVIFGGGSSTMVSDGQVVNWPGGSGNERGTSDILWIG